MQVAYGLAWQGDSKLMPTTAILSEVVSQSHLVRCAMKNGFALFSIHLNSKKITRRRRSPFASHVHAFGCFVLVASGPRVRAALPLPCEAWDP